MDRKWIVILVILAFYQKLTSGVLEYKISEGGTAKIPCKPDCPNNLIVWFRVRDSSEMEFIGSFGTRGNSVKAPKKSFSDTNMQNHILTLKPFNQAQDSGIYTCVCIRSNELKFGNVTRLLGDSQAVAVPPTPCTTTKPELSKTTRACACKNKDRGQAESSLDLYCDPIILGPLAGACGLILLLLIVTTLYCNRIRTRRCPHHYKRKPRNTAPGKQWTTNRPV